MVWGIGIRLAIAQVIYLLGSSHRKFRSYRLWFGKTLIIVHVENNRTISRTHKATIVKRNDAISCMTLIIIANLPGVACIWILDVTKTKPGSSLAMSKAYLWIKVEAVPITRIRSYGLPVLCVNIVPVLAVSIVWTSYPLAIQFFPLPGCTVLGNSPATCRIIIPLVKTTDVVKYFILFIGILIDVVDHELHIKISRLSPCRHKHGAQHHCTEKSGHSGKQSHCPSPSSGAAIQHIAYHLPSSFNQITWLIYTPRLRLIAHSLDGLPCICHIAIT